MGGRPTFLALARLFRLSIAITPVADVFTGYIASQVHNSNPFSIHFPFVFACLASIASFCFGTSLNDYLDRHKDAVLASGRPLPAGEIGPRTALGLSVSMASLALMFGGLAGVRTLAAVSIVLILAVSYNLWSRRSDWLGVLNLGCIRVADLGVGLSLGLPHPPSFSWWSWSEMGLPCGYILILYGLYGLALSTVALGERGQKRIDIRFPALAVLLIAALPLLEILWTQGFHFPAIILWLVITLPVLKFFDQHTQKTEQLVGHLVSGFFLLGALIILGRGEILLCALLWALYFVSRTLSRWMPPA
jgi:4-hydroxybenzoate polyprenyltransferase